MNDNIISPAPRPALAERLRAGLEETLEWAKGEGEGRMTLLTEAGERVGPEMMTRAQYEMLLVIADLLEWTGRKAATTDEAEQVSSLRRCAEFVLKQAGVC